MRQFDAPAFLPQGKRFAALEYLAELPRAHQLNGTYISVRRVKRRDIDRLSASRKDGMTIVPTKLLTTGRYLKLVIALGKGKKRYDKRMSIKKRDQDRESRRG